MTGLAAGLIGGRSLARRYLLILEVLVGLVSREVSRDPVVERGIPEDRRLGRGESVSVPLLYIYGSLALGDPDLLVAEY